ncbi:MAG: glycosyltransferase [Planctomycetes bacterium]|nr:glycosyltransferase [Planctomycetota bacterium]
MTLSVIIPTLNAGRTFGELLQRLADQSLAPDEIIVIDSASNDGTPATARQAGCTVIGIDRADFNHGGTRNRAAEAARGDILVFMTQDAMPADEHLLDRLTAPLRDGTAVMAYARQVAREGATPPEVFTRLSNYPDRSERRTLDDVGRLGVKAFFASNVAAAYDRRAWEAAGRFDPTVIMNEDMLACARLLRAGGAVAYQASAVVVHSHHYTLAEQFRRYFDIGVFFANAGDALAGARSTGQGLRFARAQLAYLARRGRRRWLARTAVEAGLKFLGVQMGRHWRRWPRSWCRSFSLHRGFWSRR